MKFHENRSPRNEELVAALTAFIIQLQVSAT